MPVSVSVVVPTFNPGPKIEACLRSVLWQSLPRDRYEVIVVDDGSTDGTGTRLDRASDEHPSLIKVIHTENSGWAGRPRNVGMDAAVGEYVFFLDSDDWLPPVALEALWERATSDGSDIAVGRLIGHRRAVPAALFNDGDYATTWRDTPNVFSSLTTHKLFRRAFLLENGLRFPEGPVRLEDQIFVTRAYLCSRRVSIVGTRPCYVYERRDDLGNLTAQPIDLADHFRSVQTVLDGFVDGTEPGDERAAALTRTLRTEILGKLGPDYLRQDENSRAATFAEVRQAIESIDPATDDLTAPSARVRSALVRAGDRALMEDWLDWEQAISATVDLDAIEWEGSDLRLTLRGQLLDDEAPLGLERTDSQLLLPGPARVAAHRDPRLQRLRDVTDALPTSGLMVVLRSRDYMEEWQVSASSTLQPDPQSNEMSPTAGWTAVATFDPSSVAAGRPLRPGVWDVFVRVSLADIHREQALLCEPAASAALRPALVGEDSLAVIPFPSGERRQLSLDVDQWTRSLAGEVALHAVLSDSSRRQDLAMLIPICVNGGGAPVEVLLQPMWGTAGGPRRLHGWVSPAGNGRATVEVALPPLPRLGQWDVALRFGGPGTGPLTETAIRWAGWRPLRRSGVAGRVPLSRGGPPSEPSRSRTR